MNLTKEKAKQWDAILEQALKLHNSNKPTSVEVVFSSEREFKETYQFGEHLEKLEYGCFQPCTNNKVHIYVNLNGLDFIKCGGFNHLLESKQRDEETSRKNLAAARREPWLILWGIVSTLATIVLSYLQLTKSCL